MSNYPFRTCFLSAPVGADTGPLRAALQARGVSWFDLVSEQATGPSMLGALKAAIGRADFVCGVVPNERDALGVVLELGVAIGSDRPLLVFVAPNVDVPPGLLEVPCARASLHDGEAVGFHLNAFLKHGGKSENGVETAWPGDEDTQLLPDRAAIDALRGKLVSWQAAASPPAKHALVDLVARLFDATDAATSTATVATITPGERAPTTYAPTADLAVWIDALQASIGNPLLVAVAGVDGMAARVSTARFRRALAEARRPLGLLVSWEQRAQLDGHDDDGGPLVIRMSVSEVVDAVGRGTFVADLLARRNRAVHGVA